MDAIIIQLNSWGRWFVLFALPMLIQSSLLILLLLGLNLVLGRRTRAVFRYGLLLLILLKLVLPSTLSAPTGIGYLIGGDFLNISVQSPISSRQPVVGGQPAAPPPVVMPGESVELPPPAIDVRPSTEMAEDEAVLTLASAEPVPAALPSAIPITWPAVVLLIWLAVVAGMILLLIQRALFVKSLAAASIHPSPNLLATLDRCRWRLGLRRSPRLKLSPNASSPAVCGLFRPMILIPQNMPEQLDSQHLSAVLLHELAHIKRRDLWVNLAQTILQIVYFYNPLLWLANAVIRRVREQAVDEMVLVALGQSAEQYPDTLLAVARLSLARPAPSLRLIGVVESKKALAQRIKHILNRPLPKTAKLGLLGLAVVVLAAAVLLPMAKASRQQGVPIPKNSLYEKAKPSRGFVVRVGPTEFKAHTVVRWERNGSLVIRNPDGSEKGIIDLETPDFSSQSQWMDIAQVHFSPAPERYDVLELRVFDHKTRKILSHKDYKVVGYNIKGNSVVSIYSIGQSLPDSVDVWMRVLHKPAGTVVYRVKAEEKSGVNLGKNTIDILDIKKGADHNYSMGLSGLKWTKPYSEFEEITTDDVATTVAFRFSRRDSQKYQICAIDNDGKRFVPDTPHFISARYGATPVITFGLPKDQIKYFELTPFRGRDTFFFDGVKLPKVRAIFQPAPPLRFEVNAKKGEYISTLGAFITAKLHFLPGTKVKGTTIGLENWRSGFYFEDSSSDVISLACELPGLSTEHLRFACYDQNGDLLSPKNKGSSSATGRSTYFHSSIEAPVEKIYTVELSFNKERWPINRHLQERDSEDSTYTATLPNGVTVELLGLKDPRASLQNTWWAPDGTVLLEAVYNKAIGPYGKPDGSFELSKTCEREIAYRLSNLPSDLIALRVEIRNADSPNSPRLNNYRSALISQKGHQMLRSVNSILPKAMRSLDIRIGIAKRSDVPDEREYLWAEFKNVSVQPATQADESAVRDVAHKFLIAMRDRDDASLKTLACNTIAPDWQGALPHLAGEIRHNLEVFARSTEPLTNSN